MMNLLGRILVVAILVISLLFLGFSVAVYATHKNWKAVVLRPPDEAKPGQPPGLQSQLKAERDAAKTLKDQFDKLQQATQIEDQARRAQLAKLETMRAALKNEYDQVVSEHGALKESERKAVEAAQNAQEVLDNKLQEIDRLEKQIAETYQDRDGRFKEAVALTDKVHEAEEELARLQSNAKMLKRQIEVFGNP
jgi:chromosome segregation ATPase